MSISSIYNTENSTSSYYKLLQSEQTKTSGNSDEKRTESDSVSFSDEAIRRSKMPPPPESMDFENISDDDFKSYLEKSLNTFGSLPGIDNASSVDDLTDEQLTQLRETFTEMSQNTPQRGMGMPVGEQLPLSQLIEDSDEDSLKSMLTKILEKRGSLPGLEDEEITSVENLTKEQSDKAKAALVGESKKQEQEISQRHSQYASAISAYEKAMPSMYSNLPLD